MNYEDGVLGCIKKDFWEDIKSFAKKLEALDDLVVVSHHDADGITSCAIIVDALRKLGKNVDFLVIKQLDSLTFSKVKEVNAETIVFTDMGSGQLEMIEDELDNFYVIDHHPPIRQTSNQINPHFYDYDGGRDIAGSGMAYLVAKALGFNQMAHLAVVGAVGDMQDSNGRLDSLNRGILFDAINQGTVKLANDLRLFGRQSRSLTQMLAYASDPVLPGISGNQQAASQFLQTNKIDVKDEQGQWRNYVDLTHAERKELTSALYIYLLDKNTPEFLIQRMIGEIYTLLSETKKTELRDAREYSTVLNACGRNQRGDIGVNVCLGDRLASLDDAKKMLETHRRNLRQGLDFLNAAKVESLENLYHFDASGAIDEGIIGVVAGMAYGARIIKSDKSVLAFAVDRDDGSNLKVSARTNWALVRSGIHLGNAMNECSDQFGGEGGGHDIAAGARIPIEKKNEFLACVNNTFKRQLSDKL